MHVRPIALVLAAVLAGLLLGCGGGGGPKSNPFPQALTEVSPPFGTVDGGTIITLRGYGFTNPEHTIRLVRFDEDAAAAWQVVDDRTIIVESPPGAVGVVSIDLIGDNPPQNDGILLTRSYSFLPARVFVADGAGAADPGLHAVDLLTGVTTRIGSIGFGIEAMAMGADNRLYAVEASSPSRLIRIDPVTGVGTPLAVLIQGGGPADVLDLTFREGVLLGRSAANALVQIDAAPGGGAVTMIGSFTGPSPGGGLTAVGEDELYVAPAEATGQLFIHDVPIGVTAPGPTLSRSATLRAMAYKGIAIYAIDADSGVELVRIDPATGAVVTIGPLPPTASAVARDF